jgi:type IV secretion system protein VirB9
MRRTVCVRSIFAFAIAAVTTLAASSAPGRAALPGSTLLPDGSVRFVYGRRPAPIVVCAPHYVCDIALDSGESVLNMAIGDATRWVIAGGQSGPSGTVPHVFVKPAQANLDTNLVITTTKRVYDVALHSAADAKHSRISFAYADEDAAARAQIAQRAVDTVLAGTPLVAPEQADAKYNVSGESEIAPQRVFNDGVRTYIQWKTLPYELPQVVAVAKDGTSAPVNFRVIGAEYVVDGVESNFDLVLAASPDRHGRPERRAAIRHL